MSEDAERTIDRAETPEDGADGDGESGSVATSDLDRRAERFLDLEADLGDSVTVDGDPVTVRAQVVGADTIPVDEVPDSYPHAIGTDAALALTLELPDGRRTTAYFDWTGTASDAGGDDWRARDGDYGARLERLLRALDVPADSFADLLGERVLVTRQRGYYVPVIPDSPPRGSPAGLSGVIAGLAFNLAVVAALAAGFGGALASASFAVLFLAVNLLLVPAGTYLDAWHLRTTTDWNQGPEFWAVCSALPLVNVISSVVYLYSRRRARPLAAP